MVKSIYLFGFLTFCVSSLIYLLHIYLPLGNELDGRILPASMVCAIRRRQRTNREKDIAVDRNKLTHLHFYISFLGSSLSFSRLHERYRRKLFSSSSSSFHLLFFKIKKRVTPRGLYLTESGCYSCILQSSFEVL